MNSAKKLLDIDLLLTDNGGVNYLKIRAALDDIDRLAAENDPRALQFVANLNSVHALVVEVTKNT